MRILLTGASGFIGRHLLLRLLAENHHITACVRQIDEWQRRFPQVRWLACDYAHDHDPSIWLPRLRDIDVVINAVGIFQEKSGQRFQDLHTRTPIALFEAAHRSGVRKVLQISALGADEQAQSAFHKSKRSADEALKALPLPAVILYPSIVIGRGGGSTALFAALAVLPLAPVVGTGRQRLQPVSIGDVCTAVAILLRSEQLPTGQNLPLVGARSVTFIELLQAFRQQWGCKSAAVVKLPVSLMRGLARVNDGLRLGLFDSDALGMLLRGNCADPGALTAVLGRPPDDLPSALQGLDLGADDWRQARLFFLRSLLRYSIAFLWIFTGLISVFGYPAELSYQLLAQAGISGLLAPLALYGAAVLDIGLGVATLAAYRLRWVVALQVAVMALYTAVISVALPELWLHPFGPVSKNVPLLVATLVMLVLEER